MRRGITATLRRLFATLVRRRQLAQRRPGPARPQGHDLPQRPHHHRRRERLDHQGAHQARRPARPVQARHQATEEAMPGPMPAMPPRPSRTPWASR